jgi:hypothetical protein
MLFGVACNGGSDEPLQVHLKRITDSAYTRKTIGGVAVAGELLAPIIAESHDADCRREIMKHIRECMSEKQGKRWQRIFGGLVLTEELLQHGSPALVIECAHGHHFDLIQKVSLVEKIGAAAQGCSDRRAQNVIRTKACELNKNLVPWLQQASTEELPMNAGLNIKDTLSSCSFDRMSNATPSTAASGAMSCSSSRATTTGSVVSENDIDCDFGGGDIGGGDIDEAFSSLRAWMDTTDSWTGSSYSGSLPRESSAGSDSFDDLDGDDWEPIGQLPVSASLSFGRDRTMSNDSSLREGAAEDMFFTPMPAPAVARAPQLLSL